MTIITFSQDLAQQYFESDEEFPIDFDDAWQWLGYSRKSVAKRNLKRFKEGLDFCTYVCKISQGGRPSESIKISVDCFKMLSMMAETELGDVARKYFLECEKIAKEFVRQSRTSQNVPLLGSWQEVREAGIEHRKAFNALCKQLGKNYDKYTDRCYSALFACTAETLRKTRMNVAGNPKIGRNHIEEPLELEAIARLEKAIVENYEQGMSLSRMIAWHGAIVLAELGLPQPDRKRQTVYREMMEDREQCFKRITGGK